MAGYNRIIMMGNLTRDPEYKQLTSGQAVCRLGLASNRQFKNRQTGNMVQEVCYIDIDVWGAQAESCRQYLQKGRAVLVEGRIKLDTWEDPNGQTRNKHSIVADRVVFLSSNATLENSDETQQNNVNDARLDPNNKLEKELLDQLDTIKKRQGQAQENDQSKTAETQETTEAGGINFKDEPPFQDDLPF